VERAGAELRAVWRHLPSATATVAGGRVAVTAESGLRRTGSGDPASGAADVATGFVPATTADAVRCPAEIRV